MFKRAVAVEYLQTGVPRTEIAMKYGLSLSKNPQYQHNTFLLLLP